MMGPGPGAGPGPGSGPGAGPGGKARAADVRGTARRIFAYFARERAMTAGMLVVVMCGTVFGVIAPSFQSRAIDCIAGASDADFAQAIVAMLVLYLLYTACQLGQGVISVHLSTRIVQRMREELFGKAVDLPIRYMDEHSHGDLMSRMTNDIELISKTVSEALPSLVGGVLTLVGTVAVMLWFCWQLACLSFLTVVLTLVATKFLASRVRRFSRERQDLLGQVNGMVEETCNGFHTVVAYNRQKSLVRQFGKASDDLTHAGIRADSFAGVMGPIMNSINNVGFVVIAAFGGLFALHGIITVGVISAFIVYAKQFGRPVGDLAQIYGQLQSAMASAERVFSVLDEASEDAAGEALADADETVVVFEHVQFGYDPSHPVLHDFSLRIPAGKKVALVGATGSGKTTVVSLLERFYDVDGGRILINGQDVRDLARASLRRNVAIVLQDTTLVTGTVRENLSYANPQATRDQVEAAARMSCCADFINALPQGFDTVLEDAGARLSQGQRQLLAIARAFVADPRVLVLDEATSNVDTRTERAVQCAMQRIMENRTSIVIAHRLSTIQDADVIVVMDAGRICEMGTHAELLRAGGVYRALCETQLAGGSI